MTADREWVSFQDDTELRTWVFDVTFLLSRWSCIFGRGCQGVLTGPAPELVQGCCSYGAHFTDEADVARVERAAATLGPEEWQFRAEGRRRGVVKTTRAGDRMTRMVRGACIFLNRPGFPGGYGCALHAFALRSGVHPLQAKPDVCWQLPIRRTYRWVDRPDETRYLEITIGEYDRRGWGPGGHDLVWWCTGATEAHVAAEPLYRSYAAELTELMGAVAYASLVALCEEHEAARASGRLPVAVHPADPQIGARGQRPTRVMGGNEPAHPS